MAICVACGGSGFSLYDGLCSACNGVGESDFNEDAILFEDDTEGIQVDESLEPTEYWRPEYRNDPCLAVERTHFTSARRTDGPEGNELSRRVGCPA